MTDTLVIGRRYRGPLTSANGGWAAGVLAEHVVAADAVEVTLRLPPPLETPLEVRAVDGRTLLLAGDSLVAEARPAELVLDVRGPVSPALAAEAARHAIHPEQPQFAECFVCGTRPEHDGLELHVGLVSEGDGLFAAPWVAREPSVPLVWASIDCPGAYAVGAPGRNDTVLGRITARVVRLPRDGERCCVTAWPLGEEGRKLYAATALHGEAGDLIAAARQVWIAPRPAGEPGGPG